MWARRRRELARDRNRVANHLHALLCELVLGEITANLATDLLAGLHPITSADLARQALAHELLDDLRRLDRQIARAAQTPRRPRRRRRTTITQIFGVGPVVAAIVLATPADVTRFPTAARFAAFTGTAPIEASSGPYTIHRLSRRGNRQLNHAIHIAAVTQIRNRHTAGRAYYDRKIAEGKSRKMALRALKRRISDAVYHAMITDARHRKDHHH